MLNRGLLALAFGTFALGIAEFTMMGILSTVAADFGVTIPQAGDFISAYSLGVSLGAPSLLFFSRLPMKRTLLLLAAVIVIGNLVAALSQGYYSLLGARVLAGLPHGAYFGVAAVVAQRLVAEGKKVEAVSMMVTGMTMANVVGVPLATFLTNMFSWRVAFGLVAVSGALALCAILLWVPRQPRGAKNGPLRKQFAFLGTVPPWLVLAGTFFGQGSLYCWYSYVEPIMVRVTHIPIRYMTLVMMLTGVGMVVGGVVAGRLADRHGAALVTCLISALAVPILALIYLESSVPVLSLGLAFVAAAAIFGLGSPLQYLIVRYAPGGEMLGGACIQVAFNVSNAVAASLGGWAIGAGLGYASPALVGMPLAGVSCLLLLILARKY